MKSLTPCIRSHQLRWPLRRALDALISLHLIDERNNGSLYPVHPAMLSKAFKPGLCDEDRCAVGSFIAYACS